MYSPAHELPLKECKLMRLPKQLLKAEGLSQQPTYTVPRRPVLRFRLSRLNQARA